jgi:hypothetical protein
MARPELIRQLAQEATRPIADYLQPAPAEALPAPAAENGETSELFVWFEDTHGRARDGKLRGAAGLPESLLPWPQDGASTMQIVDRRYAEGHFHLLSAVRLRVRGRFDERIAALYTAALSVGTVAWIGRGGRYERAWDELFSSGEQP